LQQNQLYNSTIRLLISDLAIIIKARVAIKIPDGHFDSRQGDQIGRIFTQWLNVYFGLFFENYQK
jgi:hypothetical protein